MRKNKGTQIHDTRGDRIFGYVNAVLVTFMTVLAIYPLIYVCSASISSPDAVNSGKMWLLPVDVTLDGYKRVFRDANIWNGYKNTIIYTVTGTLVHLGLTLPSAYALACTTLPGKKMINRLLMFTMFFGGGLIPSYLLWKNLGILDTIWAVILPGATGYYNIVICKTYFQTSLPQGLEEAAEIDGCNVFQRFFRIALPLSAPIIAVTALFHAVGRWNSYFNEMIVLKDASKYPLQVYLKNMLSAAELQATDIDAAMTLAEQVRIANQIKFGAIVVATLPIILVYPFLQRYFVKGVMVGSMKG